MTHEEIKALLAGITKGDWHRGQGDPIKENLVANTRGIKIWGSYGAIPAKADANFIAAAPAIIRQLLEEVEALEKERDALQDAADNLAGWARDLSDNGPETFGF